MTEWKIKKALLVVLCVLLALIGWVAWNSFLHNSPRGLARRLSERPESVAVSFERFVVTLGSDSREEIYQKRKADALDAASNLQPAEITKVLPLMIRCLADSNSVVVEHAAETLARIGPSAELALCDATTDRNPQVRAWAIISLSKQNEVTEGAVNHVLRLTETDPDEDTRIVAIRLLPKFSLARTNVVPLLEKKLHSSFARESFAAAVSLWKIDPSRADVLSRTIVKHLPHVPHNEIWRGCLILQEMGANARPAESELLAQLQRSTDDYLRFHGSVALLAISSNKGAASEILLAMAKSTNAQLSARATAVLERKGPINDWTNWLRANRRGRE